MNTLALRNVLPNDICQKIQFYNPHPVADLLKNWSEFDFIKMKADFWNEEEASLLAESEIICTPYSCGVKNGRYGNEYSPFSSVDGDVKLEDDLNEYEIRQYTIGYIEGRTIYINQIRAFNIAYKLDLDLDDMDENDLLNLLH